MKTLGIFPAISLFALTLTLLRFDPQIKTRTVLLWSAIVTILFGGLMTWFSVQVFFFVYYANFLGVIILIPCLTYLTNKLFKDSTNKIKRIRLLGLGLAATVLTIAMFATSMSISFAYNSMDPAPKHVQNERGGD